MTNEIVARFHQEIKLIWYFLRISTYCVCRSYLHTFFSFCFFSKRKRERKKEREKERERERDRERKRERKGEKRREKKIKTIFLQHLIRRKLWLSKSFKIKFRLSQNFLYKNSRSYDKIRCFWTASVLCIQKIHKISFCILITFNNPIFQIRNALFPLKHILKQYIFLIEKPVLIGILKSKNQLIKFIKIF